MIKIKNLKKSYGNSQVLKGINIEIETGDIYGIVGMSGAGKSTLLSCITGLEKIDSGNIEIDDKKVEDLDENELRYIRRDVGFIFQSFSLLNRKSVYENIALPLKCWKVDKNEIKDKVFELAKLVGLENKLDSRPSELSGGQKQRVAIARALSLNPKYIICDEFTSSLDPKNTNSIIKLIMDVAKKFNITVIVVTHEMSVIKEMCNKMSILKDGIVVESGDTKEMFFKRPESLMTLIDKERDKFIDGRISVSFELSEEQILSPIFYDLSKCLNRDYILTESETLKFKDEKVAFHNIYIYKEDYSNLKDYFKEKGIEFN